LNPAERMRDKRLHAKQLEEPYGLDHAYHRRSLRRHGNHRLRVGGSLNPTRKDPVARVPFVFFAPTQSRTSLSTDGRSPFASAFSYGASGRRARRPFRNEGHRWVKLERSRTGRMRQYCAFLARPFAAHRRLRKAASRLASVPFRDDRKQETERRIGRPRCSACGARPMRVTISPAKCQKGPGPRVPIRKACG